MDECSVFEASGTLGFIIINGQSQQVEATTSERILAQTALQSHACSFTKLRKLPLQAGAEPKARKPQVEVFNLKPELTPEASILRPRLALKAST